jgi:hypothetical protein
LLRFGCQLAGGRLRRNLDCAGPGHGRGRNHPRVAVALRTIAWAKVLKENTGDTQHCDNYGYYRGYRVTAPIFYLSEHLAFFLLR